MLIQVCTPVPAAGPRAQAIFMPAGQAQRGEAYATVSEAGRCSADTITHKAHVATATRDQLNEDRPARVPGRERQRHRSDRENETCFFDAPVATLPEHLGVA
jgi:hypothetical protein